MIFVKVLLPLGLVLMAISGCQKAEESLAPSGPAATPPPGVSGAAPAGGGVGNAAAARARAEAEAKAKAGVK
jgi:hypothetical protein